LYLYLPKKGAKPYPAVVYFPSSAAIRNLAPTNLQVRSIDFVIKSGRAVLYPVFKGTYQRSDSLRTDVQDSSNFYRDHLVMWAKDLRRGIDYLETPAEVGTDRLAYYGLSWGGAVGIALLGDRTLLIQRAAVTASAPATCNHPRGFVSPDAGI